MFYWAPRILVRTTVIKGFYNYLTPNLDRYVMLYDIFPIIELIVFAIMVFSIYRYNAMETYYKNKDVHINKSINTASVGMRVFTHAIKNHIQAIKSESDFLREKHRNDNESTYSLDLILDSCAKCFESLEIANHKLKNIELDMYPTSLDVPIKKALDNFKTVQSKIRITYCYANIPKSYIDENHLSEVLCNIINNAIEAIGKENAGEIHISLKEQSGWGIISIIDDGPGIQEEYLPMLFEPFFSTHSSVNNWGIGLSYCHKIITAHDGKISVESKSGKGTTFRIALPII
ncbi:sensor histidine kinase [Vallitalea maricola]|uniref:sensor histidine kinase n=1 Tax=Vallitalea maricola TaxID=3074433 RepID=UPI0030DCA26F